EDFAHQHLPFERLIEHLQPPRDMSRSPVFQVMFIAQNTPREAVRIPGLDIEALPFEVETAKFDLTVTVTHEADGTDAVGFEYATDLFDRETVQGMAERFVSLLEQIAEHPERSVFDHALIGEDELERITRYARPPAWTGTSVASLVLEPCRV